MPVVATLADEPKPPDQPTPVAQPKPPGQPTPVAQPTPPGEPTPVAQPKPPDQRKPLDIGRSTVVVNVVDGRIGDAPPAHLKVDDDILFSEDIATQSDSRAVIEFRDGSTFELGPNALARIDKFVFNPEESTSEKSLSIARGVFRYVSGFTATNQEVKIAGPAGTIGIRGSLVVGIVEPEVPLFLHLSEGSASFTNNAGTSALEAGDSLASPSNTTQPMQPSEMPPAVAAEAVQAIDNTLPPPADPGTSAEPTDDQMKRLTDANLLPVAEQQQLQASVPPPPPLAPPPGPAAIVAAVGLLVEAQRVNLFDGARAARTPQQTAFLQRVGRLAPTARAALRRYDGRARTLRSARGAAATVFVLHGVARHAPGRLGRVTAAALHANPRLAGVIRKASLERGRGPGGPHAAGNRHEGRHAERGGRHERKRGHRHDR